MGRISFYFQSKSTREKGREALTNRKNPPGNLFRTDMVACAAGKDINNFVLLTTPRKTKDPSKKRPLLP